MLGKFICCRLYIGIGSRFICLLFVRLATDAFCLFFCAAPHRPCSQCLFCCVSCASFHCLKFFYYRKGNKPNRINYMDESKDVRGTLWWQFSSLPSSLSVGVVVVEILISVFTLHHILHIVLSIMMSAFCSYNCEKFCLVFRKLRTRSEFCTRNMRTRVYLIYYKLGSLSKIHWQTRITHTHIPSTCIHSFVITRNQSKLFRSCRKHYCVMWLFEKCINYCWFLR